MTTGVKITGLNEFVRDLRKVDRNLPKMVRLGLNSAVQIVVDDAKPRVPVRSGKAKASIKAKSTTKLGRVAAGGSKAVYFGWLDFGGRVGRNNSVYRPRIQEGRYIWRAFKDNKTQVLDKASEALVKVAEEAGIEVD